MIICTILILIGIVAFLLPFKASEEIGRYLVIGAAAVIFAAMRGKGAENHDAGAPQAVLIDPGAIVKPTV